MKINIENCSKKSDIEDINKKIRDCAPLYLLKELADNFKSTVSKEDLNLTSREISYLKKDIGKLINKEEFIVRLNVLNSEMNTKLE